MKNVLHCLDILQVSARPVGPLNRMQDSEPTMCNICGTHWWAFWLSCSSCSVTASCCLLASASASSSRTRSCSSSTSSLFCMTASNNVRVLCGDMPPGGAHLSRANHLPQHRHCLSRCRDKSAVPIHCLRLLTQYLGSVSGGGALEPRTLEQATDDLRTWTDAGSCGRASSLSSSSPSCMRSDSAQYRDHVVRHACMHACGTTGFLKMQQASNKDCSCCVSRLHHKPDCPPPAVLCRADLVEGCSISASSPKAGNRRELASSSSVLSACRGRLRLVASAGTMHGNQSVQHSRMHTHLTSWGPSAACAGVGSPCSNLKLHFCIWTRTNTGLVPQVVAFCGPGYV